MIQYLTQYKMIYNDHEILLKNYSLCNRHVNHFYYNFIYFSHGRKKTII